MNKNDKDVERDRHSETVAIVERDGLTAGYRFEEFDGVRIKATRLPEDEFGHEENFNWSEIARMVRNHTMRIYGMTPEEVENLDI